MRKNLITIAALAVTILAPSAHALEVIKSASATKAELTQYWSQHNNHGLRAVNTTATTLHSLSGRPYAVFTAHAAERMTGFSGSASHSLRRKRQDHVCPLARQGEPILEDR